MNSSHLSPTGWLVDRWNSKCASTATIPNPAQKPIAWTRTIGVADCGTGPLGHFHGSVHARYGYDIRAEIFGSDGAIELGRLNHHDVTLRTESDGLARPSTFQTRDGIPHAFSRFPDAYRNEIVAFADTIANGITPTVDHHDALTAYRVALTCQQSATQRRPVDLTEIA